MKKNKRSSGLSVKMIELRYNSSKDPYTDFQHTAYDKIEFTTTLLATKIEDIIRCNRQGSMDGLPINCPFGKRFAQEVQQ
jgi:hypothetical protein